MLKTAEHAEHLNSLSQTFRFFVGGTVADGEGCLAGRCRFLLGWFPAEGLFFFAGGGGTAGGDNFERFRLRLAFGTLSESESTDKLLHTSSTTCLCWWRYSAT